MKKIQCSFCGNTQDIKYRNCTKCGEEMPERENISTSKTLIDKSKAETAIVRITCSNCGYEGAPKKWDGRTALGIVFVLFGFLPAIVFFTNTNPYACSNCKKRDHLTKIYNNGNKYPIKSKSKNALIAISIAVMMIIFGLSLYSGSQGTLTKEEEKDLDVIESFYSDGSYETKSDYVPKTELGVISNDFNEGVFGLLQEQTAKMEELDIDYTHFRDLKDMPGVIELREDVKALRKYDKEHYSKFKDLLDDFKEQGVSYAEKKSYIGKDDDIEYFQNELDTMIEDIIELEVLVNTSYDNIDAYFDFVIEENDKISVVDDQVIIEDEDVLQEYNILADNMFEAILEFENAADELIDKFDSFSS